MLKFGRIRWKNLLSTGNVFTEIDLSLPGTTLIVGDNGAGKTTVLDALSLALYGKPYRDVTKPQMVNTINQKDCLIELEFQIGDVSYMVRRGMKPNVFEVFQDGSALDQHGSVADLQEYFERNIVKMNHRACMQVVVLGAASFVPFMDLPKGHRREVMEDILDLKIISSMNSLLKTKVSNTAKDLIEANAKRDPLSRLAGVQKMYKGQMIEERLKKIQTAEARIDKLVDDGINMTETKIDIEKNLSVDPRDEISRVQGKLAAVNNQIEFHRDRLSFFSKNDECPTCSQGITAGHKHDSLENIERDVAGLNAEKSELEARRAELLNDEEKWKKEKSRLEAVNNSISLTKNMIMGHTKDLKNLKDELERAKTERPVDDDSDYASQLDALDKSRAVLTRERDVEDVVAELLKDSGVKAMIVRQYIPVVNKLINKYLAALDFFVSFELDDEFNEKILSRHRDSFTYHSFSQGEKMRIDLALLFTWRAIAKLRNTAATNIVIMDEIFDSSLDSAGVEDFTAMMSKLVTGTNTFIISHRTDQIFDKFDRVIKFEKAGNFSRTVPI